MSRPTSLVSRISMSIQPALLEELDAMVADRGYASRSAAVGDMVNAQLVEYRRKLGSQVMVGSITLHYDRAVPGLQKQIAELQYEHLDEVISSLQVQLARNQVMEVMLVQGRANHLQKIADEFATRRGVISCCLQVLTAMMPPIQSAER